MYSSSSSPPLSSTPPFDMSFLSCKEDHDHRKTDLSTTSLEEEEEEDHDALFKCSSSPVEHSSSPLKYSSSAPHINAAGIFNPVVDQPPDAEGIKRLFETLPAESSNPQMFSKANQNYRFNRYTDIFPFNHNIFSPNQFQDKTLSSYYLNASEIKYQIAKKKMFFVAAQGPLEKTINEFWKAIVAGQVKTIVNLTMDREIKEQRVMRKCFDYWSVPPILKIKDKDEVLGEIEKGEETENYSTLVDGQSLVKRSFEFTPTDKKISQTIVQHHYQNWPDNGIPNEDLFDQLLTIIENSLDSSPLFVHCSAGIGRTGVVIATLIARQIIKSQIESGESPQVNIIDIIEKMRSKRVNMVQNANQLEAIYSAVVRFAHQYKKVDVNQ